MPVHGAGEHLRPAEALRIFLRQFIADAVEVLFTQPANEERPFQHIIGITILIRQQAVERLAVGDAVIIADDSDRIILGIHRLDIPADQCLQVFKRMFHRYKPGLIT